MPLVHLSHIQSNVSFRSDPRAIWRAFQIITEADDNRKHRTILMPIYSAGLRLGEWLNLRVDDLHTDTHKIFIKAGKGKKDRYTILASQMKTRMTAYLKEYKPRYGLFESPTGEPESLPRVSHGARSVQVIVQRAIEKAKVNPEVYHAFRVATHLLERGTNNRYIQGWLGHASVKTTEIYTAHLSRHGGITQKGGNQVVSGTSHIGRDPLDHLDLGHKRNRRNGAETD